MRLPFAGLIFLTFCFLFSCREKRSVENGKDSSEEYEIAEPEVSNGPRVHMVEISQLKFIPDVLNVRKGDTVIWTNKDIVQHDVTEVSKSLWTSTPMATGATYKRVFTETERYYCSLHVVMTGKVIVDGRDIAFVNALPTITTCVSTVISPSTITNQQSTISSELYDQPYSW